MRKYDITCSNDCLLVNCTGQITFEVTANLRRDVEQAIDSESFHHLVMNMSEVDFIDSSGIGVLVTLNSKIYSIGKRFHIAMANTAVKRTLELVKIVDFFDFIDNKTELELLTCTKA